MRVINFSADGITTAKEKGFFEWVINQDADIICIQDIRAQEFDLTSSTYFPEGYLPYFFDHPNGQNGVAIYTRHLPKAIMSGLGFAEFDHEARYIQADFDNLSVGSIILPRSFLSDPNSLEKKAQFLDLFYAHLEKIKNKRREFIFAGNWQIAAEVNDVEDKNIDDIPGFLLEERRWMDDVRHQLGYSDAFREINHDDDEFSWWPNENESGWRVDTQIVSDGMKKHIEYGSIYKKQQFSSHAPVIMDYDYTLGDEEL